MAPTRMLAMTAVLSLFAFRGALAGASKDTEAKKPWSPKLTPLGRKMAEEDKVAAKATKEAADKKEAEKVAAKATKEAAAKKEADKVAAKATKEAADKKEASPSEKVDAAKAPKEAAGKKEAEKKAPAATPPTVLTGDMSLKVVDRAAFLTDPKIKSSLQAAVANLVGVTTSQVEIVSMKSIHQGRRLGASTASGIVDVKYKLTDPSHKVTPASVSGIAANLPAAVNNQMNSRSLPGTDFVSSAIVPAPTVVSVATPHPGTAAQQAAYVLGEKNTNQCPAGSGSLTSSQCKTAVEILGFQWLGSSAFGSHLPQGCVVSTDDSYAIKNQAVFNTDTANGNREDVSPVCQATTYKVGDRVEGLYKDGNWYKGTIEQVNVDGSGNNSGNSSGNNSGNSSGNNSGNSSGNNSGNSTYTLRWDDGDTQDRVKPAAKIRLQAKPAVVVVPPAVVPPAAPAVVEVNPCAPAVVVPPAAPAVVKVNPCAPAVVVPPAPVNLDPCAAVAKKYTPDAGVKKTAPGVSLVPGMLWLGVPALIGLAVLVRTVSRRRQTRTFQAVGDDEINSYRPVSGSVQQDAEAAQE